MAFQSSVLRDGEWVTQTVSFQDALNASSSVPKTNLHPRTETPACGIVSRTIIESPVVHWVLPVWLRSRSHNDLAFIGVSSFPSYGNNLQHTRNDLAIFPITDLSVESYPCGAC